jgi:predicted CoA-substrate-specific enzyme activase
MVEKHYMGIDIGSTTIKIYITDEQNNCIYAKYERHFSDIRATIHKVLKEAKETIGNIEVKTIMTGSGGLSLSQSLGIPFMQEVIACTKTVETYIPECDVAIELGGEDAKITYFEGSLEQRMNGTCAGGTGAFIDQMASLLQTDAAGLNTLAKNYEMIYPIASRCGVFAKTDVQPLINEGANKEDIAMSIFQAVVNQTISGLACGKPIRGKIAFLGGPLYFLSQLRRRFIETLQLKEEDIIFPDNSQLFVAMGACLAAKEEVAEEYTLQQIIEKLDELKGTTVAESHTLEALFKDEEEKEAFRERHGSSKVKKANIKKYQGNAYLGIDVGSTTTKAILIDENESVLYSFYDSNEGNPLEVVIKIMKELYSILPEGVVLAQAGATGYGEALVKAALKLDMSEVETIAHYKAAAYFNKDVSFILDIGGQDMKAIRIQDGVIQDILLNEACSSGCGSFIETFANSLGYNVRDFAEMALDARTPIDLGSRCTVFMNSKVKQAQKEGAKVEDISAGLSYSVIKNALYKVIKLRSKEAIGDNVLVQGGTFYNESVLRAFEKESGIEAIRPDIAGLMGAFGIARLAKEHYIGIPSTILTPEQVEEFSYQTQIRYCDKCTNNCMLTVSSFNDNSEYISGNRCERGANIPVAKIKIPNLFDYKYRRVFNYRSLNEAQAKRGSIGIPRVLNMYENYPFWHTLFTDLKFRVVLSPRSTKEIFEKGMESIPSESVCYPAKLAHGHIEALIEKGIDTIFYPSVNYERKEFEDVNNHYNCPVVTSYPEVIKNNVDTLETKKITFKNPFLDLTNKKTLLSTLLTEFKSSNISKEEMKKAIEHGYEEMAKYQEDIRKQGEEVLQYLKANNKKGIVLAGRPYHVDPEIHHGLAELITGEGMAVLSEDSICHLYTKDVDLRVVDQWTYHSRLYRAATFVTTQNNLQLVQLTSFGCGLDAVTSDQVAEILQTNNKIYTLIKIDEGSNLGAIRIRIRSLKATIDKQVDTETKPKTYHFEKVPFTEEMKQEGYTILCPQMSPIHFQFVEKAMKISGYNLKILPSVDKEAVNAGLKYVNNDACYPTILVTGQIMEALQSGEYDLNKTAVIITQTGGGCRATNYIAFIRKALKDANMGHIPVISANLTGLEDNPGFKITLPLAKKVVIGAMYGDLFMRVLYRVRPYEAEVGAANRLYESWVKRCLTNVTNGSLKEFKKNIYQIVSDFDNLPLLNIKKPRVGLVGEILVKFHPTANNEIVDIIEKEGGEAVMPDLIDFFQYCFYNTTFEEKYFHATKKGKYLCNIAISFIEYLRKDMVKALNASKRFYGPSRIEHVASKAESIVSLGNQHGEGWFLTGEMIELIENDAPNIVCMQPFGCLPNHVTGKGAIKALRKKYPSSNIVAIDYDPGASETNQLNRIKLMLSTALKNVKEKG